MLANTCFIFIYIFVCSKSASVGHRVDVPYARLLDASPTALLPPKLDSDSRLQASRSILSVPEAETAPKSSISDSRLAVDYFNTTAQQYSALVNSALPVSSYKL